MTVIFSMRVFSDPMLVLLLLRFSLLIVLFLNYRVVYSRKMYSGYSINIAGMSALRYFECSF